MAELNNVTAEGIDGDLVFKDASGNIILRLDAANRKLEIPSGSALDIESGGSLKLAGTAITATAAELNKLAVASFNNKSGYVARVNSGETASSMWPLPRFPLAGRSTTRASTSPV